MKEEQSEEAPKANSEESSELSLERLQEKLKLKEEELLRARAEIDNQRKRNERNVAEARQYGITKLLEALLPLRDSMELGIDAANEEHSLESFIEGCALNLKTLDSILTDFGVELIAPQKGDPFDLNLHEAICTMPTHDLEPDTVFQIHQKGVRLNGRMIRPSRVVVAKKPDEDNDNA